MKLLLSRRLAIITFSLITLLVSSACQAEAGTPAADSQGSEVVPVEAHAADSQGSEVVAVEADVVFGPGAFALPDPNAGLADLSSYKAGLTLSFDGTRDGQAGQWSKTYVLLSTREPAARQLTIEKTGDVSDLDTVFMAEADGAAYESRAGSVCNATVIDRANSQMDRLAPAALLTGAIGAEEAGSETVNDVAASRYTFDERAIGQVGLAKSTGEIWVASEGGYVVRYLLTTQGIADFFGKGIEGKLTFDYELTDVNQPVTIELPADCPLGLVDAPLLPDASNVLNVPSILAYDTVTGPAEAAAFYEEQIPSLGWELIGEPTMAGTTAVLDFTQANRTMTVILTGGDGGTKVLILLSRTQQ